MSTTSPDTVEKYDYGHYEIDRATVLEKGVRVQLSDVERFERLHDRNERIRPGHYVDSRDRGIVSLMQFLAEPGRNSLVMPSLKAEDYVLVRMDLVLPFFSNVVKVGDVDVSSKPTEYDHGGFLVKRGAKRLHAVYDAIKYEQPEDVSFTKPDNKLHMESRVKHYFAVPASCFPNNILADKGWLK